MLFTNTMQAQIPSISKLLLMYSVQPYFLVATKNRSIKWEQWPEMGQAEGNFDTKLK